MLDRLNIPVHWLVNQQDSKDSVEYQRYLLLALTAISSFIVIFPFIPFYVYIHFQEGLILCLLALVITTIVLYLVKKRASIPFITHFCVFCSYSFHILLVLMTGGVDSSHMIWLLSIPILVYMLQGQRSMFIWTGIIIFSLSILQFVDMIGFEIPSLISPEYSHYFTIGVWVCLPIYFSILIITYDHRLKMANKQLHASNKEISKSNDALASFAHVVSHDIMAPINKAKGFVSLSKKKIEPDNRAHEFLSLATNSLDEVNQLVQDVLNFSKIDGNPPPEEEIDLNEIVKDVKGSLAINSGKKKKVIAESLPKIKGVRSRWLQLFQNLIGNGLKYNKSELPQVKLSYHNGAGHVFTFQDNGIGIPKNQKSKIFEMFNRLHTKDKFKGSGIGLATCKKIVEEMGGQIVVNSEEGAGSEFKVILPDLDKIQVD